MSIKSVRNLKNIHWELASANTLMTLPDSSMKLYFGTLAGITLAAKLNLNQFLIDANNRLLDGINRFGLLDARYEKEFPEGWMKPAVVGMTHHIIFVNGKGNLVLKRDILKGRKGGKENRMEYYRYLTQNSEPGKLGMVPWRWRIYIR